MIDAIVDNVRWGIIAGLFFALIYTLFVTIIFAARGSAPFAAVGSSYPRVIVSYFVTGIAAGSIVGLLRPLLRWRVSAIAVGIVAAFAVFVGIALVDQGWFSRWDSDAWITCTILAAFFGTFGGLFRWRRSHASK